MSRKKSGQPTGRGRGGVVTSKPDVYVSVYCSGTPEHPHGKWRIASFHPEMHDGRVVWRPFYGQYYEPESPYAIRVAGNVAQWLDGDKWVSQRDHDPEVFYGAEFRVRWNLACRECGMRRAIAKPSDYYDALTALAQVRVAELELLHFVHAKRHAEQR